MLSKCGKNKKVAHEAIAECANEAVSLVAGRRKIILIGPRKSRHCQT